MVNDFLHGFRVWLTFGSVLVEASAVQEWGWTQLWHYTSAVKWYGAAENHRTVPKLPEEATAM